jgi:hypothetical protein
MPQVAYGDLLIYSAAGMLKITGPKIFNPGAVLFEGFISPRGGNTDRSVVPEPAANCKVWVQKV